MMRLPFRVPANPYISVIVCRQHGLGGHKWPAVVKPGQGENHGSSFVGWPDRDKPEHRVEDPVPVDVSKIHRNQAHPRCTRAGLAANLFPIEQNIPSESAVVKPAWYAVGHGWGVIGEGCYGEMQQHAETAWLSKATSCRIAILS